MIVGSWSRGAPAIFAIGLEDRQVVNRSQTPAHQSTGIELPVLVSIGAEPVTRVIVPFVGEAHGNTGRAVRPDFLDQPVVELAAPLAPQEFLNRRAAVEELGTVAPLRVLGIGERYALRVARVPRVLGHAHL